MKFETKTYRFDEITTIFDKKRIPLSSAQRAKRQGTYRYYGAQGVIDYVDDYIFDGKYLLIAEDGENLKSKKQDIAQIVEGQFWVNNHAHIVQGNELCLTDYLCHLLNSMDLSGYITGSAQPKLSQANMNAITVELPPVIIQKKIISVLGALNRKITLNQQINDNLLMQMRTVYQSLCATDNEREKSDKMWKLASIDEICSLVSRGIAPKYSDDTNEYVINQKCIRNSMIDTSLARQHTPKKKNEKWIQYGDLLVNSTGDGTLGRTAQVWFHAENMTVDSHVTIMRPCRSELMYYLGMWGISNEKLIESLHTGSTGQTELPRERLKALQLPLPDTDVLVRFNATIKPMTEMIMKNQQENKQLEQMRDRLLPKLMSGEIII